MQGFERGDDKKMSALRDRLQQGILAQVEEAGVNGDGAPRVPNTTNIYFDHIEGEAMVIALDLKGLAVSTGAACSSGAIEPSHVLTAMGLRAGSGASQHPLQPGQAEHGGRYRLRAGVGAGDGGAVAGVVASCIEKASSVHCY